MLIFTLSVVAFIVILCILYGVPRCYDHSVDSGSFTSTDCTGAR